VVFRTLGTKGFQSLSFCRLDIFCIERARSLSSNRRRESQLHQVRHPTRLSDIPCLYCCGDDLISDILDLGSVAAGSCEILNDVTWPPGVSLGQYLDHLWLGGAAELLRPMWSLVIEWRVSLAFPVIAMLFIWSPILAGAVTAGLVITIASMPHSTFAQSG
jgi:hypothetical protein